MNRTQHLRTLPALAERAAKLRRRGVNAHLFVCGDGEAGYEMLVGALDERTCSSLAELARHLQAEPIRIASSVRLRTKGGLTVDVAVATDLSTGRQAVVRLSDGAKIKCGKVRHEGVAMLMEALKAVREKDSGREPLTDIQTATPPRGRGRLS